MFDFSLEDFLALPLAPSMRVRVSPTITLDIDQDVWEARKAEFIAKCQAIPNIHLGPSWRELRAYTNSNGLMAKLLIALGEEAGVWIMHPPLDLPELWKKSPMYPMILADSAKQNSPRRVPKPSAGDLEHGVRPCLECHRLMDTPDTEVHGLREGDEGRCTECTAQRQDDDTSPMSQYLKQFR